MSILKILAELSNSTGITPTFPRFSLALADAAAQVQRLLVQAYSSPDGVSSAGGYLYDSTSFHKIASSYKRQSEAIDMLLLKHSPRKDSFMVSLFSPSIAARMGSKQLLKLGSLSSQQLPSWSFLSGLFGVYRLHSPAIPSRATLQNPFRIRTIGAPYSSRAPMPGILSARTNLKIEFFVVIA